MATVADCYEETQAGGIWMPTFRRNLSMEETTHIQEMCALLTQFRLTANMADRWTWRWEKSGCFSVKSAYLMLIDGGKGMKLWNRLGLRSPCVFFLWGGFLRGGIPKPGSSSVRRPLSLSLFAVLPFPARCPASNWYQSRSASLQKPVRSSPSPA
ncbi:hypothetical protein Taro_018656 [Colocasia esculenta]|uniref:Uncharacterized protein n=1 Tax=Colocasia esculenta TaxID=4460 RepID=A0A843UUH1_COLES|nr:hypothetical protein [Colocasia esculenta]